MTFAYCTHLFFLSFQVQEHPSDVLRRHRQRTWTSLQTQQRPPRWAGIPNKVRARKKPHQHLPIRFPDHHFLSVSVWDDIEFEASRQAVWATEICSLYSHMLWSGSTLSTCFFSFLLLLAVSTHFGCSLDWRPAHCWPSLQEKTTKTNWIINTLFRHKVTNLPDFLSVSKALKFTHDL